MYKFGFKLIGIKQMIVIFVYLFIIAQVIIILELLKKNQSKNAKQKINISRQDFELHFLH